ncbi:MAG: hypothetical protein EKK55_17980 [Rhodocyclaceae bacterium]|nr:MAG: hypothetical protein EKK55_17980 [Rhodocyclaceae bacterium]
MVAIAQKFEEVVKNNLTQDTLILKKEEIIIAIYKDAIDNFLVCNDNGLKELNGSLRFYLEEERSLFLQHQEKIFFESKRKYHLLDETDYFSQRNWTDDFVVFENYDVTKTFDYILHTELPYSEISYEKPPIFRVRKMKNGDFLVKKWAKKEINHAFNLYFAEH